MKILVLCNHGNVRSVALKYLIQRLYDHDVLAAGVEENNVITIDLLITWSDKVISLTEEANTAVSAYPNKEQVFINVGKDIWHNPFHHELQHILLKHLKGLWL